MAQLDQMQISYAGGEDRMMLRVSTGASEEFRFWLTRRFVKLLRPQLEQHLVRQPHIQTQASTTARRELLAFEREQAIQGTDFKTPYRAAEKTLPLGETPVLLTRFALGRRQDGALVLALAPETGRGVDIALNPQLLHSLAALLDNTAKSAEWDLEPAAPTEQTQAMAPTSTLN